MVAGRGGVLRRHGPDSEALALPDYLLVAPRGLIEEKSVVIAGVDNLSVESVRIEHQETRRHGETIVLIGTVHLEATIRGHRLRGEMRYLSVFVRSEGAWRLAARSLQPILPIPPAG